MQTSLARRQRIAERSTAPPGTGGSHLIRRVVIAFALTSCPVVLARAWRGLRGRAYNHYAPACPTPRSARPNIDFEQQTIVYDRTGKIELARLGSLQRELVTFDAAPGEMHRRHDRDRGQGLLDEPGLRPGRHRVGRLDTISGKPARRVDDHPAARARPAAPGRAFEGTTYERKAARSSSRSA
jgi:hypothetical protein